MRESSRCLADVSSGFLMELHGNDFSFGNKINPHFSPADKQWWCKCNKTLTLFFFFWQTHFKTQRAFLDSDWLRLKWLHKGWCVSEMWREKCKGVCVCVGDLSVCRYLSFYEDQVMGMRLNMWHEYVIYVPFVCLFVRRKMAKTNRSALAVHYWGRWIHESLWDISQWKYPPKKFDLKLTSCGA